VAGIHNDHSVHLLVSGEAPRVGLRVMDNDLKWGTIVKVATDAGCGWYCNAWHDVLVDNDGAGERSGFNCERLTTRDVISGKKDPHPERGFIERGVYYTASLIVRDGSNVGPNGEECEPGDGAHTLDGYVDPEWSWATVGPSRDDDAVADVFDPEAGLDPVEWLAERVLTRVAPYQWNGDQRWYAADSRTLEDGKVDSTACAHAYGFTDEELARAAELINPTKPAE
jgi:hypothetical protein